MEPREKQGKSSGRTDFTSILPMHWGITLKPIGPENSFWWRLHPTESQTHRHTLFLPATVPDIHRHRDRAINTHK
jgi:hypothetical protein